MTHQFPPPTREPVLIIRNTSNQSITILGRITLRIGETANIFQGIQPEWHHDLMTRALRELTPPTGVLYNEWKVLKRIEILDFSMWHSSVDQTLIRTANQPFEGASLGFDGEQLTWEAAGAVREVTTPLSLDDGNLSIRQANALQDGYISKEDYQYIFASLRRRIRIWQYQDFNEVTSTAISLSAFQNGIGLSFDGSYILSATAHITKLEDLNSPPTSTDTIPTKWLPSSRVKITSHIGDQVTINQLPAQAVRIFFQITLPDGVNKPYDYQEAPKFLIGAPSDLLDEYYANQNDEETIFGEKVYAGQVTFGTPFVYTDNVNAGYVLTSDTNGQITLQPPIRYEGLQPSDAPDLNDGYLWLREADSQLFTYDTTRDKWLGDKSTIACYGNRNTTQQFLYFNSFASSAAAPFRITETGTLTATSLSASQTIATQYIIYVNNGPQYVAFITATTDFLDDQINIDVEIGDQISVYCSDSLEFPEAKITIRSRA